MGCGTTINVFLSNDDMENCRKEGARRQKRDSVSDDNWRKGIRDDCYYVGLMSELAVARWLGLDIDRIWSDGRDGGVDFVYEGKRIDVKTTSQFKLVPCVKEQAKRLCDYFVFCISDVESKLVIIDGWLTWEEVAARPTYKSKYGNWRNHSVIERSELHKAIEFKGHIRNGHKTESKGRMP